MHVHQRQYRKIFMNYSMNTTFRRIWHANAWKKTLRVWKKWREKILHVEILKSLKTMKKQEISIKKIVERNFNTRERKRNWRTYSKFTEWTTNLFYLKHSKWTYHTRIWIFSCHLHGQFDGFIYRILWTNTHKPLCCR